MLIKAVVSLRSVSDLKDTFHFVLFLFCPLNTTCCRSQVNKNMLVVEEEDSVLTPASKHLVISQFINKHMEVYVINSGVIHKHGIFWSEYSCSALNCPALLPSLFIQW